MKSIFDEYRWLINQVKNLIIANDKWSYLRQYLDDDRVLLNLSFRGGWGRDFFFDDFDEFYLMKQLILLEHKPIGSIVSQTYTIEYFEPFILLAERDNLKYTILKNRWQMLIMFVYKYEISIQMLKNLNDEYLPRNQIGALYGYNNYKFKKSM